MRAVRLWLYGLCLMVLAMVMLGGATRLTDSGLSISEWQPIMGALPPLGDADWQDVFQKYQQTSEYARVNSGMSLDEFKSIFWWEWAHRFLGRLIGLLLVLPWLAFTLLGRIPASLHKQLLVMLLLGGMQGGLGWFMVKSGLVDRVDVSHYRLALHLLAAAVILGYILWVALGLRDQQDLTQVLPLEPRDGLTAGLLVGLLLVQIGLGALVAGLHAGLSHNTWPLMDGALIPDGLGLMQPAWINLFENVMTVQFDHRMVAYLIAGVALAHAFLLLRKSAGEVRLSGQVMLALLLVQIGLGIATLLLVVPLPLALAHQGLAFVTYAAAVWHLQLTLRARAAA
jgi:cytochrome c oxidase assembly protein subunit 15